MDKSSSIFLPSRSDSGFLSSSSGISGSGPALAICFKDLKWPVRFWLYLVSKLQTSHLYKALLARFFSSGSTLSWTAFFFVNSPFLQLGFHTQCTLMDFRFLPTKLQLSHARTSFSCIALFCLPAFRFAPINDKDKLFLSKLQSKNFFNSVTLLVSNDYKIIVCDWWISIF